MKAHEIFIPPTYESLKSFLEEVNHTRISDSRRAEPTVRDDGMRSLTVKSGLWRMVDVFGGEINRFGTRTVWHNDTPKWAQQYSFETVCREIQPADVLNFVAQSMTHVGSDRPFCGQDGFRRGELTYSEKTAGNIEDFHVDEKVIQHGRVVGRGWSDGGFIR